MHHCAIVVFLFIVSMLLHPFWGWHQAGYGPFFGALAMLILLVELHHFDLI